MTLNTLVVILNPTIFLLQGTLGMRNERILRHLLEMIDLDSSEYVRLMVCSLLRKSAGLYTLMYNHIKMSMVSIIKNM